MNETIYNITYNLQSNINSDNLDLCVKSVVSNPTQFIISLVVIICITFYMIGRTPYKRLENVTNDNVIPKVVDHFKSNVSHYLLVTVLGVSIGLLVNIISFLL